MTAVQSLEGKSDAARIAVLVRAVDKLAAGEPTTLGALAESIFGWSTERTFQAIDRALHTGLIERAGVKPNADGGGGVASPTPANPMQEPARIELLGNCETLEAAFAGQLAIDPQVLESFVYGVREFLIALDPKASR